MLGSVFGAIANALQRFDIIAKWSIFSATMMYVLMVVAVLMGFSVLSLLFIYLIISIATALFYFFYSRKLLPKMRVRYEFDSQVFKPTIKFSFFVFINNIANTALLQIDKFFISAMLGPAFVTFYTLPGNIAQKTQGFISSISSILFPLSSDLQARQDLERLKSIYRRAMRMVLILAFAISIIFLVFGQSILFYWLGEEVANKSIVVLYYLIPTYFLLAIFIPVINFLLGLGRSIILAWFSILMGVLNIILIIFLIPRYSIEGAAIAYVLSVLPILLFNFDDIYNFYGKIILQLIVTSAIFGIISFYVFLPLISNIYSLIIVLPIAFFLYLFIYKLFGFFEREDWQLFKEFFLKSMQKLLLKN